MRALILAAGRFGEAMRNDIAAGLEPRLDVFEIGRELGADLLDFDSVESASAPHVRLVARGAGPSAALAVLGFEQRRNYDAIFTTGEDIGLPLGLLLRSQPERVRHTMIAHTLWPAKKQVFFRLGRVAKRIDKMFVYSTSEERLAIDKLGLTPNKIQRIYYHADEQFFRPDDTPLEPDLICAAGQLLRDYDCLAEAVREMPVRVQIAAGSPWISKTLEPQRGLPSNVKWGRLSRFELRKLYRRSALAVVPIRQNHYQTGIATILEMMAMSKCVIASRTHGQTDTIVDGVTGVYVPPADPGALRSTIERLLANPDEAARIGRAARQFVEENAGLDRFVKRIVDAVKTSLDQRVPN
jgi:glycosyltransferase involved in cell wall biosynthesis